MYPVVAERCFYWGVQPEVRGAGTGRGGIWFETKYGQKILFARSARFFLTFDLKSAKIGGFWIAILPPTSKYWGVPGLPGLPRSATPEHFYTIASERTFCKQNLSCVKLWSMIVKMSSVEMFKSLDRKWMALSILEKRQVYLSFLRISCRWYYSSLPSVDAITPPRKICCLPMK